MEYFDLYNETAQKIGKQVPRGTKLLNGEYHLVVNVWIRNEKGEYLIQQRNKLTDIIPFMWATTAGAVVAGDTSLKTALKETLEEIGVVLIKENLKHVKRYFINDDFGNYIMDIYLIEQNVLLNELLLNKLEVKKCKYASMKEIITMIKNKTFWDYIKISQDNNYFELIEKS